MRTLDLEAVQAFVLVADLRGFTRAAAVMGLAQSAVSLKLKRLEDRLGRRLLERTPRHIRLTAEGAAFLEDARRLIAAHDRALNGLAEEQHRLAIGISEHAAGPELPLLLSRLSAADPALALDIRIGHGRDLLAAFDQGGFDAVIVRREPSRRDGDALGVEPFHWFAAPSFRHRPDQPLRLATLAAPCAIRAAATGALDEAGIAWRDVFVGGGIAALGAAVTAGLAVAALSRRVAPPGAVDVGAAFGLPALPPSEFRLHSSLSDARSRAVLKVLATAYRGVLRR